MKKIISFVMLSFAVLLFISVNADDLSSVWVKFCDPTVGENLTYTLQPGTETGICYVMTNNSKSDLMMRVAFVDGGFTNDQRKNKACQLETDVKMFWQYVTWYQQTITLKGWSSVTGNALLNFPEWMNGLVHGCLVYSVVAPVVGADGKAPTFSIQMRKAKFIDALVGTPDELSANNGVVFESFTSQEWENLSSNPKIRIYKDLDDKYIVAFKLKNVSIFDQNVAVTWVASNILMYKNVFSASRLVPQNQTILVAQKLDSVPNYNLTVLLNMSFDPILFGEFTSAPGTVIASAWFMIWNIVTWLTLLGILVVVWIVYLLIMDLKKRKSNVVNASKKKK